MTATAETTRPPVLLKDILRDAATAPVPTDDERQAAQRKRQEAWDQEQREAEARARAAHLRSLLESLAVPPLYKDASLETFRVCGTDPHKETQGRMLQLVRRYLSRWPEVPPVVVFAGGHGTGKGHVSWSVAKALVEQGARCKVVKFPALIRDLRESWEGGPSENLRLRNYRGPDLLVIDEVSSHALTAKQTAQHLYDIIDDRVEHLRATILTTNEDDAALTKILGPAIADRLMLGNVIRFGAESFRARRDA